MSEKSADVVTGLVTREALNGRRTYSIAAKRSLAELCRRPGVSVAATALQHGVNANLLRRWINEYSGGKQSGAQHGVPGRSAATLLPVTAPMPSTARTSSSSESYIEISFAAATILVRGTVDARVLGVVLDCLAQRA